MFKVFVLLSLALLVLTNAKPITDKNLDLFKYDPKDVYSLPEDIDEEKPAVIYKGDNMKAKVEHLENYNARNKYKLNLRTQNGIQVTSVGKLKDDKKTFVVSGSYSFTGANGKRYRTRYTADEFGYHPITELDIDIPETEPVAANSITSVDRNAQGAAKNRFQFLNQNLDAASRGSGQSSADYSSASEPEEVYESHENGYDYSPPKNPFQIPVGPSDPSRQYLPAF